MMIIYIFVILLIQFIGTYIAYFYYLNLKSKEKWDLILDYDYMPNITILIPAHNEEKNIRNKLENIFNITYPRDKLEIILIDDGSTDNTVEIAKNTIADFNNYPIILLEQKPRKGKTNALNFALNKASNNLVIVTDADSIWGPEILKTALPYISNPSIGAITGRSVPFKNNDNWVSSSEVEYLDLINILRLGESKIHSTLRFEGVFCIFKRDLFDEFDSKSGADDSGTALKIVQNGYRAILVPELTVYTEISDNIKQRSKIKTRRAIHLNGLWLRCFSLLLIGKLKLPKIIAIPEILISIFNPIIFILSVMLTFYILILYPTLFIPMLLIALILLSNKKLRSFTVRGVMDQIILFYATIYNITKKSIVSWERN